jgi:hypothetical protein
MNKIDLSNQKFGHIKAIKPTDKRNMGSVIWKCVCDCGNTCYFSARKLKESTKSKSCGCKPTSNIKDLTGQVFGGLEVLEITDRRRKHGKNGGGSVVWKCKCHDCGRECYMSSRTLLINQATSCGCSKVATGKGIFKNILSNYKKNATERGFCWELTEEQTKNLIFSNCYYCGLEPSNGGKRKIKGGVFTYNGIDRVNNEEGYYLDNVVSCCKPCNRATRQMTLREFEDYIFRVYNYYFIEKKNTFKSYFITKKARG